jgi:hypothetical protein
MAAVAALLDVTAERGGAASLDRGHGTPLCRGQRRAVLITESRAEVAEHIRHFQPLACHKRLASGRHEVRHDRCYRLQRVQRAGGSADRAGGDTQIP